MKPIRWVRRGLTWGSIGLAGGALIVTARHILSTPQPLESTLPGEGRIDRRRVGDIYYTVAGSEHAEPVVLLHGFYPGASNYEFRRIFPRLAVDYRVYAPDWLGFGMSERPALAYTGEFYAHLLAGFLRETVGRPATVIAHGLAANITVRAASEEPDLFGRLVLVSPRAQAGTAPAPNLSQSLARTAQRSSLGMVPYAALATRTALRWQLNRRAGRPGEGGATDDALDHIYASSHQFGGQHTLLALLSGELDLPIQNAFAMLEQPVLIVAGELDQVQPRQTIEDLAELNPDAKAEFMMNAGDAVYEDQPAAFVERAKMWLLTPHTPRVPATASTAPARSIGTQAPPLMGATPAVSGESGAVLSGGIFAAPGVEQTSPADTAPASAANRLTERFGEPRGMVTPTPGLESLEGLTEQAPEMSPVHDLEARTPPAAAGATQAAVDGAQMTKTEPLAAAGVGTGSATSSTTDSAARTIGKPAGELDEEPTPSQAEVNAVPAPANLAGTQNVPASAPPAAPSAESGGEGDNVPLSRDPFQPATSPAKEVATWPTSMSAATEQTARTLAQIEEQVAEEAKRVESEIQAGGAPGTAHDRDATQAEVTDGAAPEAPLDAPNIAAETTAPAPEQTPRTGSSSRSSATQRPENASASHGQPTAGPQATGTSGAETSGNRRNRPGKGGRGTPYAAAPREEQPGPGHHESRGPSGRRHSGHKRKNPPR